MISIFVYFYSNTFAAVGKNADSFIKNPALYPKMLAICMFVLSLVLLLKALIKKEKDKIQFNFARLKKVFVFVVVIICYIYVMVLVGYIISTMLFIFVSILLYKGSKRQALIYTLPITFAIYFGFNYLLNVMLPKGVIFP